VAIRLAAPSEVPALAGVLARAFAADPMVLWPLVSGDDTADPATFGRRHRVRRRGWIHVAGEGPG
jgi:hypothetical protein